MQVVDSLIQSLAIFMLTTLFYGVGLFKSSFRALLIDAVKMWGMRNKANIGDSCVSTLGDKIRNVGSVIHLMVHARKCSSNGRTLPVGEICPT